MTRYLVMWAASDRFRQRWNDLLVGAAWGAVLFFLIRELGIL